MGIQIKATYIALVTCNFSTCMDHFEVSAPEVDAIEKEVLKEAISLGWIVTRDPAKHYLDCFVCKHHAQVYKEVSEILAKEHSGV